MKWFEHQTSDRKELASKLIKRKFGIAGYGIFQSLLEIIGENMENDNVQEWGFVKSGLKMKDLAEEIGCSEDEFRAFVTFCDEQLILELKNNRLFCPFVLERMNEYASRISAKAKRKENPVNTENTEIPYITENSASHHITTQTQNKEKIYKKKKKVPQSQEAGEIIRFYNQLFKKDLKTSTSWERNLTFWLETYTLAEIQRAFEIAKKDSYWRSIITPEILFRCKNQRGEDCDRIGEFLSKEKNTTTEPQFVPYDLPKPEETVSVDRISQLREKARGIL